MAADKELQGIYKKWENIVLASEATSAIRAKLINATEPLDPFYERLELDRSINTEEYRKGLIEPFIMCFMIGLEYKLSEMNSKVENLLNMSGEPFLEFVDHRLKKLKENGIMSDADAMQLQTDANALLLQATPACYQAGVEFSLENAIRQAKQQHAKERVKFWTAPLFPGIMAGSVAATVIMNNGGIWSVIAALTCHQVLAGRLSYGQQFLAMLLMLGIAYVMVVVLWPAPR